jgi:3' terminal RNA ribose 2'-O-methyltransferase Hen1
MLLTLTTTHEPATDLGYLLHKNPAKVQTFNLPFGRAQVFYSEASPERCTAALLLEIDPIGLVRGRGPAGEGFALQQYVNDRPYAASSFLSVAISQVFGSALGGRCKDRPLLAEEEIPLEAHLNVVPCRPGEAFLRGLFEPLGYAVVAERHVLDARFPDWGDGWYFTLTLRKTTRLCDLLRHLYVLVPVLDNDKHYWIGDDEVDKLVRQGEGWLSGHPQRESIVRRYLKHRPILAREALGRLLAVEEEADATDDPEIARERRDREEEAVEKPLSLNEQRLAAVLAALRASGAVSVLDLGCGRLRTSWAWTCPRSRSRLPPGGCTTTTSRTRSVLA